MRITGHPVGVVVEGPLNSQEGRRVDSRPAAGGRASSRTDATGAFSAELHAPLDRGKPAEGHAAEVLVQVLRENGDGVERVDGDRDDHGEDALLLINGEQVSVQIVTLPSDHQSGKNYRVRRLPSGTAAVKMPWTWYDKLFSAGRARHAEPYFCSMLRMWVPLSAALSLIDTRQCLAIQPRNLRCSRLGSWVRPRAPQFAWVGQVHPLLSNSVLILKNGCTAAAASRQVVRRTKVWQWAQTR